MRTLSFLLPVYLQCNRDRLTNRQTTGRPKLPITTLITITRWGFPHEMQLIGIADLNAPVDRDSVGKDVSFHGSAD